MEYGIADLSIVPLRKDASEASEMKTQLLFGDLFEIIKITDRWCNIRTVFDNYEGWIDNKMYKPVNEDYFNKAKTGDTYIVHDLINIIIIKGTNHPLMIVAGSSLPLFDGSSKTFMIENDEYEYHGEIHENKNEDLRVSITNDACEFLNAPYLWGGKTPFGIDCSGLTQIVYKLNGISILRDAAQQATQGNTLNILNEAQPGDLAFFDNDKGKITHVGIILEDNKIIHASGKVRIDTIDHQGIFNEEKKVYTHKLRVIQNVIR